LKSGKKSDLLIKDNYMDSEFVNNRAWIEEPEDEETKKRKKEEKRYER
jgi:hypothetical protein